MLYLLFNPAHFAPKTFVWATSVGIVDYKINIKITIMILKQYYNIILSTRRIARRMLYVKNAVGPATAAARTSYIMKCDNIATSININIK